MASYAAPVDGEVLVLEKRINQAKINLSKEDLFETDDSHVLAYKAEKVHLEAGSRQDKIASKVLRVVQSNQDE